MKENDYDIPEEIRSNRVEDLFKPCWIVKAQHSDRVDSSNEESWIALAVFEDAKEMLELIGEWGQRPQRKPSNDYEIRDSVGPDM